MRAGTFNFEEYLNKLNEESTDKGFVTGTEKDGILIPQENKKAYDWLKKEYQKGKTEVKVEMKLGNSKFEPGYALQTDLKSVKDFKPGMFGNVKTGDNGKKGGATPPVEEPKNPNNKGKEVSAEQKDPKGKKETADKPEPKGDKSPKGQQMQLNMKSKKEETPKKEAPKKENTNKEEVKKEEPKKPPFAKKK